MPRIIVIDPGHGGTAIAGGSSPNNATGPKGLLEKKVTLEVGGRVASQLTQQAFQVLMTRSTDVNVGINKRAQLARSNDAAVFVSIHFNADSDPTIQGSEAWLGKGSSQNCRLLARGILDRILSANGLRDRGVKTTANAGDYGVINPSNQLVTTAYTLIEVSFLTDPVEEQRLRTRAYLDAIGRAVALGIEDYMNLTSGSTEALHFALRSGSVSAVRSLLKTAPDVNARDSSGMTPLMIASHTGNSKMITLLLKSGADPHAKLGGVAKSPPRPRRTGTRSPKPRRRKRGSV